MTNWIRHKAALHLARRPLKRSRIASIISFTFDDFPVTALSAGGRILEEYGLKATYYAAFGLMGKESPVGTIFSAKDVEKLLAQGHELGCHTFAHCHAWNTKPGDFERAIRQNADALRHIATGYRFATLSYPISNPHPRIKRIAAKYFRCCRGGGQTCNNGTMDLNNLSGFFLERAGGDAAQVMNLIDRTCDVGGWLIFATHDIANKPSRFGCTARFFEDIANHAVRSGARILPVGGALEEISRSQTDQLLFSGRT